MKPTNEAKLLALEERLLEVFLDEGDPRNWPSAESAQAEAERLRSEGDEEGAAVALASWRGARLFEKKNAAQTIALMGRIVGYRRAVRDCAAAGGEPPPPGRQLRDDISEAESRVRDRLRAIKGGKR